MITNTEVIEMLGGIEAVEAHIRELVKPIAAKKNTTVDELLNSICYSEGSGYETTYGESYMLIYLDGYREGMVTKAMHEDP